VPQKILVLSDDGPRSVDHWNHHLLEDAFRVSLTKDYSRSFKQHDAVCQHVFPGEQHEAWRGDAFSVLTYLLSLPNHGYRAVVIPDVKPQLSVEGRMNDGMCRLAFLTHLHFSLPVISFHSEPLNSEESRLVSQTLASLLRHMRGSWIHLDYYCCLPSEVNKWLFVDNNELPLRSRDLTLFSQHNDAMFVVGKMADEDTEEIEAHAPNP